MSFPASPTVGQQATEGGRNYQWSGYAWEIVANVSNHAASHAAAGSDPVTINVSQVSGLTGNRGDITVSGNGSAWTINSGAVVTADIANGAVTRVKMSAAESSAISLYLWSNFR